MLRLLKSRTRPIWALSTGATCRWMSSGGHWRKTTVMSFGDGSHGALGLPTSHIGLSSDAYEPTPIPDLPPNISSIAAGHYHSLAVTSEGHVWAWGRNFESQLGRYPLSPRGTWNIPKRVEELDQIRVQAVSASGVISAAIGDDGSLWVWGMSKRGQLGLGEGITEALLPARVEALVGEEIVKVSLGWGHALALTKEGKLFGWGYYADGRLGKIGKPLEYSPLDSAADKFGSSNENSGSIFEAAEKLNLESIQKEKNMPIIWKPSLIEEVYDIEVADISCGLDHSLILCCDGTLISCGSNVYGQLGREKPNLGMHPVDINLHPVSIAAGMGHSLAICQVQSPVDDFKLVSWGWNHNSQLGRDGPENVPLEVEGLADEKLIAASGGRAHSMIVTEKKEIWTWGCGRNGRLGLGSSVDETEPKLVEYLEGVEVIQAVAGYDHSLALVKE